MTTLVDGPRGPLELFCAGKGEPVTLFAHGVGASVAETRPYAGGVLGTRVFYHARGHGNSVAPPEGPWTYADLAADLRAIADAVGATRALGSSLGAGALLRAVAETPERFDRLVFVLPAALDRDREPAALQRTTALADAVEAGAVEDVARLLSAEQHPSVRDLPAPRAWARGAAERIAGTPVSRVLREAAAYAPIAEAAALSACQAPVLVLGQEDDETHPASVARAVAAAFPSARLELFGPGGLLWAHRREVRDLLSGFLNAPLG